MNRPSLAGAARREGNLLRCSLQPVGEPESVGALLVRHTTRFPDHPIHLEKRDGRYVATTWSTFRDRVAALAGFLTARGVQPGDRVATVSRNRGDLLAAEFAVMGLGCVFVPIFPGYGGEQTAHLLRHAGAKVLIAGGAAELEKFEVPGAVRTLVAFEPVDRAVSKASSPGVDAVPFEEALAEGARDAAGVRRFLAGAPAVDPRAPSLMMYTSGTAGEQKGVLLTHDNILSQQRALAAVWSLSHRDRLLSYLPWHHSFGGIFEKYNGLYNAAPIAVDDSLGKDFPTLLANWKTIRPTVYFSVPLVHQQLVDHVRTHPEDEPAVFHPEMKFVFTAAAPLPANISEFFAAKGIPVVEGWGLTETSPCCTLTDLHAPRRIPGMVGHPIPGVTLQLAEDGEILVQGPNVMAGYYHNPEADARALPGDGWFHTGDLGEFVDNGLKLLTRKDRIFKMLNAEKVVPTLLENRLAGANPYIRHVLVVGDGKGYLAALVFPNFALIEKEFGDDRDAADRAVKASYRRTVEEINASNPVKYEHIQAVAVVGRTLTVNDEELTPSMKVRVRNVLAGAQDYVRAIYEPLDDCDCRFLRRVMRLAPDARPCLEGKDVSLDRCHECGRFVLPEDSSRTL